MVLRPATADRSASSSRVPRCSPAGSRWRPQNGSAPAARSRAVDVLDLLDSLVRKSLVTVERSSDIVRYGLLETIRQFGEEERAAIGESEAIRTGSRPILR